MERYQVEPINGIKVLREVIKCHNNEFAVYIRDNLLTQEETNQLDKIFDYLLYDQYNYDFFPDEINDIISNGKSKFGFKVSDICFTIKSITISSSITSIADIAFNRCSLIIEIIIPDSVASIGEGAFYKCTSL